MIKKTRKIKMIVGYVLLGLASALTTTSHGAVFPITNPDDARTHGLESLKTVVENEGVPLPNNLNPFIKDMNAARQLGKALFHEMAAGSDGVQACITCHFRAGADPRSKNQLSPDLLRVKKQRMGDVEGFFNAMANGDNGFEIGGPNYQLRRNDFPFVTDIKGINNSGDNVVINGDIVSPVPGNSNDVTSSQGVLFTRFDDVVVGGLVDDGTPIDDDTFNVGDITTRRVEPRNTPTMINAVFNFTNFWDGRATNRFNGENPFGKQDKVARIFKAQGKKIVATPLNMKNASLASQAVGPPLSHFEMSFGNGSDNFRIFPDIGRKLLSRVALSTQAVAASDSLLADLRDNASGMGLTETYEDLIRAAFNKKYWDSNKCILMLDPSMNPGQGNQFGINNGVVNIVNCTGDPNEYSLMESNFAFLWGVSVMLYEATLVSDEAPFDNWMRGVQDPGFGSEELAGLNVFVNKGKCINCHSGPELTAASVRNAQGGNNVIESMLMGDRQPALYDNGFYNIGVTPTVDDTGRGGADPFGPAPLAFSRQFAFDALNIQQIQFPIEGAPIPDLICDPNDSNTDGDPLTCDDGILGFNDEDFGLGFFPVCNDLDGDDKCGVDDTLLLQRVAVDGAFKVPGLRNVEETAPYMHNGGFASLMEVVEFYNRGGNFCRFNGDDLDPDIQGLGLSTTEKTNLVKFLISLTDPRVLSRAAPFDGPGYSVPNGHPNDQNSVVDSDGNGQADDVLFTVAAVGAGGGGAPLAAFLDGVDHFAANPVAGGICSPNFPPVP